MKYDIKKFYNEFSETGCGGDCLGYMVWEKVHEINPKAGCAEVDEVVYEILDYAYGKSGGAKLASESISTSIGGILESLCWYNKNNELVWDESSCKNMAPCVVLMRDFINRHRISLSPFWNKKYNLLLESLNHTGEHAA